MNNNGWVPLYRSIKDWKFSKDLEMVGLWAHFLTSANHEDGYDRDGNIVKKGSFRTGRKMLANDFGLSESKVERMIKKLIKSGEIEQQTFSKYRVISIVNWSKYQLSGQQTNNKRTTSEQQSDTNNKKEKKEKNIISPLTSLNLPEELNNWCNSIPHSTAQKFLETYDSNFLKEEIENAWLWNQEQVPSKQKKSPARFLANWFKRSNNENKLIKKNGNGGTVLDESFLKFFKGE